ncbi:hypothetical protein [Actinomadura sp. NEAU-AAG7]|uniref:hypothetical protein n=1 Tax=Actinomadura sp. NEAU-AAG7 TaxID=2839640 RepID=UPI001BE446B8|nr:hypothetical protein [Actinomadura sp. NEAU-AAG7]MBT2211570.1 hypothetical protein [Actinomadura sp. NEAU-AAG7]
MTNVLAAAIIAVALVAAAHALVTTVRDRAMGLPHLIVLGVLEVLLVAQVVVGFVKIAGDEGPESPAMFIGYMLGALLVPLAGAGWGVLERSRYGPGVIVVACLAVAVMVVRMRQIWDGTGV